MKKRLFILTLIMMLCINTIQVFADSSIKSENNAAPYNISDIPSIISKAVSRSSSVKAKESALRNDQTSYDNAFDASIEIDHRLLKKYKDYFINVRDILPLDAKYNLFAAENSLAATQNYVTVSLYEKYISLIKILNDMECHNAVIQNEKDKLSAMQKKYTMGTVSVKQIEEQQKNIKKAELNLSTDEFKRDMIILDLNTEAGAAIDESYNSLNAASALDIELLKNNIDMKDIYNIKSFDDCLKEALESREEILNANEYLKTKESQFEKIKTAYPNKKDTHEVDAMNNIADAKASVNSAKIQVEKGLRDNYEGIIKKIDEINNNKEQLNIKKTDYETIKVKNEKGMVSATEVQNSYIEYSKFKNDITNSEYDLYLLKLKFGYLCGIGMGQNTSK